MDSNTNESLAFGARIKDLRKKLNLTQSAFGEKIGLTQNTITKYENGLRNASNQIVLSICREFNVNESWLKNGKGEMFKELDREEEITLWASKITRSNYDQPFVQKFVHMLTKMEEDEWELLEKITCMIYEKEKD